MIRRALGCVVVFGGLMAGASALAHHSTAGVYDPAKEGEVTGTLANIKFVNPHGSIVITVSAVGPVGSNTTGLVTDLAAAQLTKLEKQYPGAMPRGRLDPDRGGRRALCR